MQLPTMFFGLAALLAAPALLIAQGAGTGAEAAKQQTAASKPNSASKSGKSATKVKKIAKKVRARAKKKKAAKPPTPAKELFGAAKTPAPLAARAIGFYAKGCLAGAAALPIDGPAWQAMRLSRNRNWGHPDLIKLVERLAVEARQHDGWPGLLVGDISQPRGGPMLTGHASHQVGLDADIWLTPMPDHRLTRTEREQLSATSMLAEDRVSVNPKVWSDAHVRILKRAASYPAVERVLVHPAIKKAMCDATADDKDRSWLRKIRPYWGHHYHFHVRIGCPKGSAGCESQPAVGSDIGCGAELTGWLKRVKPRPPAVAARPEPKPKPGKPAPKRRPITLDQLPEACRTVLASGSPTADTPSAQAVKSAPKADQPKQIKSAPTKASLAQ